jgi:hypothetical protein
MAVAKVNNIEAMQHSADDMQSGVIAGFANDVQGISGDSAWEDGGGTMPQGAAFMSQARSGRELLVSYLSSVLDGLQGYKNVIIGVHSRYSHLSAYSGQQMTALLTPSGPIPVNSIFDWDRALVHQQQTRPPVGGGQP